MDWVTERIKAEQKQEIFSLLQFSEWLWGPSHLLYVGY
jgi:hypothetical protein